MMPVLSSLDEDRGVVSVQGAMGVNVEPIVTSLPNEWMRNTRPQRMVHSQPLTGPSKGDDLQQKDVEPQHHTDVSFSGLGVGHARD